MLFVLSRGELGGAERSAIAALRYKPTDIDVNVLLLSPGEDEEALRALGIPARSLPQLPASLPGRGRLVAAIDRELTRHRPAVVYAIGNKAAMAGVLPAARRRMPMVWNKCDSWYDGRGAGVLALLCKKVFVPSPSCADGIAPERVVMVDPVLPIDPGFSAPLPVPPATIGSIGRLEPRKGHEDLIAAAAIVRRHCPELEVIIAGGSVPYAPGYMDVLRNAAQAHGIADRIEFLGHAPHVEDVLSRLTLLVSASYRDASGRGGESFGLAIAEAAWAGLPVVVTASGGETAHVRAGATGLVVPQRQPAELAAAVLALLQDRERAGRMGIQAAAFARARFAPELTAGRTFTELRQCARPS